MAELLKDALPFIFNAIQARKAEEEILNGVSTHIQSEKFLNTVLEYINASISNNNIRSHYHTAIMSYNRVNIIPYNQPGFTHVVQKPYIASLRLSEYRTKLLENKAFYEGLFQLAMKKHLGIRENHACPIGINIATESERPNSIIAYIYISLEKDTYEFWSKHQQYSV
jgi:hypothetical protein